MDRAEKDFTLIIPDYSECNSRFPDRYDFPVERTYGERVWESLVHLQKKFGDELFELHRAFIIPFPDGTFKINIKDVDGKGSGSIRGKKAVIIHSPYITDDRYTLLGDKLGDAVYRAHADENDITLVELYNGNYRQDRRKGRESNNAHVVAECHKANHIRNILTYDAHFKQLEALYHKFEDLPLSGWIAVYMLNKRVKGKLQYKIKDAVVGMPTETPETEFTVISPDFGAAQRAERIANFYGIKLVQVQKERDSDSGRIKIKSVLGDVKGKNIILVDDVISSGNTLIQTANECRKRGAKECYAMATHLELSGNAREKLMANDIKTIGSDTIYHDFSKEELKYFDIMDSSGITAAVIFLDAKKKSISRFFDWEDERNWELMNLKSLYV